MNDIGMCEQPCGDCGGSDNCPVRIELDMLRAKLEKAREALEWARNRFPINPNCACKVCEALSLLSSDDAGKAVMDVVAAANLKRNTRWAQDKKFAGEWIVIPMEDFDRLSGALSKLSEQKP